MDGTRPLAGQVVIITGASSGIGAAVANQLLDEGALIVVGARRAERLEQFVSRAPDRAVAMPLDVASASDNRRLVAAAQDRFGRLDSLVCAAGVGGYGGILDYSDDDLQRMLDTNVAGTVWAIRSAVPAMRAGGGGDIVVISSVAGIRGGGNEAVYAATKAAQLNLAGSVDRELREDGIRVTAICPAATATEFAMGRGREPGMNELHHWLQAEDVADAVRYVLQQPRRLRTTQWHLWSAIEGA